MKIAYFINTYPAISHVFIRREIAALEDASITVCRYSLRGWDSDIVDQVDEIERGKTDYILKSGLWSMARDVLKCAISSPASFFKVLRQTAKLGWSSDKVWLLHFAYFVEACVLTQRLLRDDVDHVHGHFGTNTAAILLLARGLGAPPYSFTIHGPLEWDSPDALSIGEKIKGSKFAVAITSYTRSQMYRRVDSDQWHKVKLVRCGLDTSMFSRHTPFTGGNTLVCIGRLVEQKGQLLLLEAVQQLQQRGAQFNLEFVGTGPLREELQSRIEHMHLEKSVHLLGPLPSDEMYDRISNGRGLVLPSFGEGLPMAIMEAMALKRPVVSTYIAGIPELVKQNETGWLVPAGDVDALADAMAELLAQDTQTINEMGDRCHAAVTSLHSAPTETRRLRKLFEADEVTA